MVRFSCFPTPIHYHRSKKSIQRSVEAIENKVQDSSPDLAPTLSGSSSSSTPLKLKANDNNPSSAERMTSSSSFECCLKSEEMNSSFSPIDDREVLQKGGLKKSQSLGSGLDKEGKVPCGVGIEDEIDQGLYHDGDHGKSFNRIFDHSRFSKPFDVNKSQATVLGESFHIAAGLLSNESIFSIGYPRQMDTEVQEDSGTHLSAENSGDFAHGNPGTTDRMSRIGKSCSLPNFSNYSASPQEGFMGPRCTSFRDLRTLDIRRDFVNSKDELHSGVTFDVPSCYNVSQTSHLSGKGLVYQEVSGEDCVLSNPSGGSYEVTDLERGHAFQNGKNAYENNFGDGNDSFNFPGLAKDLTLSEIEEVDVVGSSNVQQESSVRRLDKLPCKEFNMKRIEDWISNIDIQAGCSFQELGESSDSILKAKKDPTVIGGVTAAKFDPRVTLGMEVANNSLSLLTAVSTSAQMANLGLVVIPFLSAFISLRVLNLSGNAIVRITAGALPRGLHTLNLSKNNISAIEGLRELTRLRVLDLSYNRIFRIGHGLASCSSLKELYLAGNKISEIEGLHRLLKLNVLDLRFNKISTAKSLGQLAANYSSLQAINLEGNPAQRNVGDDQIKKYLLSLLPHLVYFNRQTIRSSSSSKEVAERPTRSITAYQHDRGLRSEHKLPRRGNHGSSTHKPASSSSHGRPSQWSRTQHGRRPPTMTTTRGGEHQLNVGIRQLDLPSSSSMRRSRSEGTL